MLEMGGTLEILSSLSELSFNLFFFIRYQVSLTLEKNYLGCFNIFLFIRNPKIPKLEIPFNSILHLSSISSAMVGEKNKELYIMVSDLKGAHILISGPNVNR